MFVGIDLGTTNSAIATINKNGQAEIIANRNGDRILPSVVMFDKNHIIIGQQAKNRSVSDPYNVCQFIKRQMGNASFSFNVSIKERYSAEEISAMILKYLKNEAEFIYGEKIEGAVITVPAYFEDAQRKATQDAGYIAGLDVMGVINEPTAAAIAFCYGKAHANGNIMVYDLGGGTFDITVLNVSSNLNRIDILSTTGNRRLGGYDFDNEIINKVVEEYNNRYGENLEDNDEAYQDLRIKAEKAKIDLSLNETTTISVVSNNKKIDVVITREEFEALIKRYLDCTRASMEMALDDAKLKWRDISKILLIGGSTRIPCVREMIEKVSGIKPSDELNPDEAVAIGAAYYSDVLNHRINGKEMKSKRSVEVTDVNSHSLGVAIEKDKKIKASFIINRNTPLPAVGADVYATVQDNQEKIILEIIEGDDEDLAYDTVIGTIELKLNPHPKGTPIGVTMKYDENGIIHVEAIDLVDDVDIGEIDIKREANLSDNDLYEKKKNMNGLSIYSASENSDKMQTIDGVDKTILQSSKGIIDNNNKTDDNPADNSAQKELDGLIGLASVKQEIKKIQKKIEYDKSRKKLLGLDYKNDDTYHFVFSGNPGTGKTTVARLLASIFRDMGLLEKGHLVEVDRSNLIGEYQGHTAIKTKKVIKEAVGGVLFIDEAYSLVNSGSDEFGHEAIDTLVKGLEDHRNDLIVILAGYHDEMMKLIESNIGLESRFTKFIDFPDYSEDELLQIAKAMAEEQHYTFSVDGEIAFREKISKKKVNKRFGNARTVRTILSEAYTEKAINFNPDENSMEYMTILTPEDFGIDLCEDSEQKTKNQLEKLDGLIGLSVVKHEIKSTVKLIDYLKQERNEGNVDTIALTNNLSMCYAGNPGTGKTTVARIYGEVLAALGVSKTGELIEVSRGDMVGRYQGETALKTKEVCERAYGGVLFIDEAYNLVQGENDSFGRESVTTLIKQMEDNRDKMIVIIAGYSKEMEEFMDSNAGIKSRISKTIVFPDYSLDELHKIFISFANDKQVIIEEPVNDHLLEVIERMYEQRDRKFGNAREMRNLFDNAWKNMAYRVQTTELSGDARRTLLNEDIDLAIS